MSELVEQEFKKFKNYWCDYCKKHKSAEVVGVSCKNCYFCKEYNHPKAWHESDCCYVNEDSCYGNGYKKSDKKVGIFSNEEELLEFGERVAKATIQKIITKLETFEWKSKTIHKESLKAGYNQCANDLIHFMKELLVE